MAINKNNKNSMEPCSRNLRFVLYKDHGLVVGDTPFFSKLIESIEGEATENGFSVTISYLNKQSNMKSYIKQLSKDKNTAGILLLATEMKEADVLAFYQVDIPMLVLDNCFDNTKVDSISIDNTEGVEKAVNYFVDCGHKDIGYLHSSAYIYNFSRRYVGFKSALWENGLDFNTDKIICLEPTIEGAYEDMKKYLSKNKPLAKALFADNDIIAMGALRALKEAGYKLPEDISIIGFDDMSYCVLMRPQLTTVRVNNAGMGAVAVRRLIDNINDKTDETVKILIRTDLVIRDSVKEI